MFNLATWDIKDFQAYVGDCYDEWYDEPLFQNVIV